MSAYCVKELETDIFKLEFLTRVGDETTYTLKFGGAIPIDGEVKKSCRIIIKNGELSATAPQGFIPEKIIRILKNVLL